VSCGDFVSLVSALLLAVLPFKWHGWPMKGGHRSAHAQARTKWTSRTASVIITEYFN